MIRLTKLTDYGIVLMTHLAVYQDRRWNSADLASETHLPSPMVSKILKHLARAGLLDSKRGASGGYRLHKRASDVSVVDIIAALDGPIALTECSDETSDECSYEAICRVKSHWQRINTALKEALMSVTLEEMARSVEEAVPADASHLLADGESVKVHDPLIILGR